MTSANRSTLMAETTTAEIIASIASITAIAKATPRRQRVSRDRAPRAVIVGPTPERQAMGVLIAQSLNVTGGPQAQKIHRFETRVEAMIRVKYFAYSSQAAVAMQRYADLVEDCGYGRIRSCCDDTVRGNGNGGPAWGIATRHSTLASVRNAVSGTPEGVASLFVCDGLLWPIDEFEPLRETAMRIMACGKNAAIDKARPHAVSIADALIGPMGMV